MDVLPSCTWWFGSSIRQTAMTQIRLERSEPGLVASKPKKRRPIALVMNRVVRRSRMDLVESLCSKGGSAGSEASSRSWLFHNPASFSLGTKSMLGLFPMLVKANKDGQLDPSPPHDIPPSSFPHPYHPPLLRNPDSSSQDSRRVNKGSIKSWFKKQWFNNRSHGME